MGTCHFSCAYESEFLRLQCLLARTVPAAEGSHRYYLSFVKSFQYPFLSILWAIVPPLLFQVCAWSHMTAVPPRTCCALLLVPGAGAVMHQLLKSGGCKRSHGQTCCRCKCSHGQICRHSVLHFEFSCGLFKVPVCT